MANKFQCHYKLIVEFEENGELVQYLTQDPITIKFNITKSTFQTTPTVSISVYNMDAAIRNSIYQDRLLFANERNKRLLLYAGYGDNLTLCCKGDIVQCYSSLESTDIVTNIEVMDFDILTQNSSVTFKAGTTFKEAYQILASDMPNLQIGEIGQLDGTFDIPTTFNGNTFFVINQLTGGHTFIDNGVLNTLQENETLSNYGVYLIDADTGLLKTPVRHEAQLELLMLFEPSIRIGQLIEIRSSTMPIFNGQYKVCGINHDCLISGSINGTRTTKLSVLYMDYLVNSNINLTQNPQGKTPVKIENKKEIPIDNTAPSDVIQVYNHIRRTKGKIPNSKVNTRFTWAELIGHSNTDADRASELNIEKLTNCKAMADAMEKFCNANFPGKPIIVTSGWRSTRNNNRCGGKADSRHLRGQAMDFQIAGLTPSQVFMKLAPRWSRGWVGKYEGKTGNFCHAQIAGNPNPYYRG